MTDEDHEYSDARYKGRMVMWLGYHDLSIPKGILLQQNSGLESSEVISILLDGNAPLATSPPSKSLSKHLLYARHYIRISGLIVV